MTYPPNMVHTFPVPDCPRCDQPARVEWCDVRRISDTGPRLVPAEMWCATPGCVDDDGSLLVPVPPSPTQLRHQADDHWLRRQRELAGAPEVATSWVTYDEHRGTAVPVLLALVATIASVVALIWATSR